MKLITDYRGEVEYSEDDIIHFQDEVFGFGDRTKFILVANAEPELPFYWLQSTEDESIVLILTNPFLFIENYDFEIDDFTIEQLGINDIGDIVVYNAVIIPEKVNDMTINLRAPFVINLRNKKAKQLILEEDYPLKRKIASDEEA